MAQGEQQQTLDAIAVATAAGTASFVFQNVPSGWSWTGTLFCSSAPIAGIFNAFVGNAQGAPLGLGTAWGAWGGQSVYGPVQALAGQTLAVTATGLTAGTTYVMSWRALQQSAATAPVIYPAANATAQTAAIAGTVATQGALDNLGTFPANATAVITSKHSYTALAIFTANAVGHVTDYVTVADATQLANPIFGAPLMPATAAATQARGIVPCANAPGDVLNVNIVGTGLVGTDTVTILGYTSPAPLPPMRADGRAYPLGIYNAAILTGGAGGGTLAAAAAPLRIMLKTAHVYGPAQFIDLFGTLGGGTDEIMGVPTTGGFLTHEFEGGELLDVGGSVTFNAGAANCRATVFYDLVV